MTTYEHGRAPADAPVTWREGPDHDIVIQLGDGSYENDHTVSINYEPDYADTICQWAHLAALADEAAEGVNEAMIFAAGGEDAVRECKAKDWLRRYRAAKGER